MPPESRSIQVDSGEGIKLHCLYRPATNREAEPLSPLILLHGGGANGHWWDHLADPLAESRPVYALDFRGHGDSDYPEEREVGAFNVDLEALISALGREDVHLVGHSLGAAVALDHTSRFPKTRSLTLLDLARGSHPQSGRRARLALSFRRTYRTRTEAVERFRFLPESSHASETLRIAIAEHSVREEPNGRFGYKFDPAWFSLPSRPRPDLSQVRCPTLLVRGEESQLLSREAGEEFASDLPHGRFIELSSSGHHVLVDQPEKTLELIRDSLARGESAP